MGLVRYMGLRWDCVVGLPIGGCVKNENGPVLLVLYVNIPLVIVVLMTEIYTKRTEVKWTTVNIFTYSFQWL